MTYREAHDHPDRKLRCPACNAFLVHAPIEDATLFGCTGCGGCWVDLATAKRVTTILDERLLELASRAEKAFADLPLPHDGGGRRCPECQKELETKEIALTNIDVCVEHGTWFDRGELERVARILEAERATAQSFTPLPADFLSGHGEKVASAIIVITLLLHLFGRH